MGDDHHNLTLYRPVIINYKVNVGVIVVFIILGSFLSEVID